MKRVWCAARDRSGFLSGVGVFIVLASVCVAGAPSAHSPCQYIRVRTDLSGHALVCGLHAPAVCEEQSFGGPDPCYQYSWDCPECTGFLHDEECEYYDVGTYVEGEWCREMIDGEERELGCGCTQGDAQDCGYDITRFETLKCYGEWDAASQLYRCKCRRDSVWYEECMESRMSATLTTNGCWWQYLDGAWDCSATGCD